MCGVVCCVEPLGCGVHCTTVQPALHSPRYTSLYWAAADRRRSNVVKEVERLKENREKRRAQQAQILEEQETLRNKDPGNPNWEFQQMILDYKDQLDFNPLQDGDPIANHQITVCIRKRPLASKEIKKKEVDVVTVPSKDQLTIHEPKSKVDLTKYLDNQNFR